MKDSWLSMLLKIMTGRTYRNVTFAHIGYIIEKGAASFLRGWLWELFHLRRPRGLLLGRSIKFVSAHKLRYGCGVSFGSGSYLDCSASGGVTIGNRVTLREYTWLQCRSGLNAESGGVEIHDDVYIGPFAVLGAGGDLSIGSGCQIGARLTISAESHEATAEGSFVRGAVTRKGISIGRDCWIGNNVCILDGVRIGDRCVIGAGSVVTRDIPAGATAIGVPARVRSATSGLAAPQPHPRNESQLNDP